MINYVNRKRNALKDRQNWVILTTQIEKETYSKDIERTEQI